MVSLSLHARTCLCASPYPIYQRKSFTTTSLRLAYKKRIGVCVGVCACTGFPSLSGDQGWCLQGTIWAQNAGVQRQFYYLSDRRSYERCEGERKTVMSWACELLYSQSWCFGISAVKNCRKYRKRLFWPHFFCLYNSLAIIYQKGCMSGLVWVPPISVLPSESLFRRFQLVWGFGWRCNCGDICGLKPKYTALCVLAESGGDIYFPRDLS